MYTVSKEDIIIIIFKMLCTHLVLIMLNMVLILGDVSEIGLTLCIQETPKLVLLPTVKTQMKCRIMRHFIRVYTVC